MGHRIQMSATRNCMPNNKRQSSCRNNYGDRSRKRDRIRDETSDRYGKISEKDTSQGFMQLLNSGNIDGSFTGSFLYLSRAH